MIRKAKLSDVNNLLSIGKNISYFQATEGSAGFWTKEQLTRWIKSKQDVILIEEEKGEILGFVTFAHHVPTRKATFENAWVHQDHRGQGIIDRLIDHSIPILKSKGVKSICTLVELDNLRSQKALERNQFEKGHDFVWMNRTL